MSDSNETGSPSGTGSVPSPGSLSSPLEHWALRFLNRLGAYALATPVAIKIPDWLSNESLSWTTKGLAIGYVLAVAFPSVLKDVAALVKAARK